MRAGDDDGVCLDGAGWDGRGPATQHDDDEAQLGAGVGRHGHGGQRGWRRGRRRRRCVLSFLRVGATCSYQ